MKSDAIGDWLFKQYFEKYTLRIAAGFLITLGAAYVVPVYFAFGTTYHNYLASAIAALVTLVATAAYWKLEFVNFEKEVVPMLEEMRSVISTALYGADTNSEPKPRTGIAMPFYLAVISQLPTREDKDAFSRNHVARIIPAISANHAAYLYGTLNTNADAADDTNSCQSTFDPSRDYLEECNTHTAEDLVYEDDGYFLQIAPLYMNDREMPSIVVRAELISHQPLDRPVDVCVGLSKLPLSAGITGALVKLNNEYLEVTGSNLFGRTTGWNGTLYEPAIAEAVAGCGNLYEITNAMSQLMSQGANCKLFITVYLRTLSNGRFTNLPSNLLLDVFGVLGCDVK